MNVSANTLFHFTRKLDSLLGILANEFKPRYNAEDLTRVIPNIYKDLDGVIPNKGLFQELVPMTCFCDIPLSAIQQHTLAYGPYGIGLTKEWARKKGLNPILYLREDSQASSYFRDLIVGFRSHTELLSDRSFVESFYEFTTSIKPYDGYPRGSSELKVFYDEREWRYVPRIPPENQYARLTPERYDDPVIRKRAEEDMDANYTLSFEPSDIRYLIVANDGEILSLAQKIPGLKWKYGHDEQLLLTTKIKALSSLEEDI